MQEIGVRLGTNADGAVQFTVTDTVEEAQEAAWALQVYLELLNNGSYEARQIHHA